MHFPTDLNMTAVDDEKEPIVRLTVDMPESLHRRFSVLVARHGTKKSVVMRYLIAQLLKDMERESVRG
jgi:predicted DNA-binding protein